MKYLLNNAGTYLFVILIIAVNMLVLYSEEHITKTIVYETRYVIVSKFRQNPKSVHEEISPKWGAILSNGDTIMCNKFSSPGDTVVYQIVKH